jgi:hypothetical protein
MAKIKVTLQEIRRSFKGQQYRVVSLVNTLEPRVGSIITQQQASELIADATAGRLEVNVKASGD